MSSAKKLKLEQMSGRSTLKFMKNKNNSGTFDAPSPEECRKILKGMGVTPEMAEAVRRAAFNLITSDVVQAAQKAVASMMTSIASVQSGFVYEIIASMPAPSEATRDAVRAMLEEAERAREQIVAWARCQLDAMTEDERAEFLKACEDAPLDPDATHAPGVM
jgi:transcriptional regulator with AAA-type ATPase domain